MSPSRGTPSQTVRAERRIILIPLKYIDVTRNTHTSVDVKLEKILMITGTWMKIVNCQIRGQAAQDLQTTEWIFIVRGDTDEDANDLKTRQRVARYAETHVGCIKTQRKAKVCYRKTKKTIMPEDCVVFISLIQGMRNLSVSWRTLVEKLENPMPAVMPSETPINGSETCRSIGKHKTNNAYIIEADESMRDRLEGVPYGYHEDHTAANEYIH